MSAVVRCTVERALHSAVACARLRSPLGAYLPCEFRALGSRLEMSVSDETLRDDAPGRAGTLIDCGAALLNARVALAHQELEAVVTRMPAGPSAALVARIEVRRPSSPEESIADAPLAVFAERLRWVAHDSPPHRDVDLPRQVTARLAAAAAREGAVLVRVLRPDHRAAIDRLLGHSQVPAQRRTPSRDTVLLLGTYANGPVDWLRTGEALQRARLELARVGLTGRLLLSSSAAPGMWDRLRAALSLDFSPQLLLRVQTGAGEEPAALDEGLPGIPAA
jgi:hypothetical protein